MTDTDGVQDPFLWLEDVEGDAAMAWVKEHNAATEQELGRTTGFAQLEQDLLDVLDSDAKIPYVRKVGDWYYNFWQDAAHERGLWRRTRWSDYEADTDAWETVLDLDALSAADDVPWVWHGAQFLRPERRLALVSLSRGGSDADITREYDVEARTFVEGGFERPEAKGELGWIDADTVYVATDFGPGSMTDSGYPRIVKEWARGTPMSEARTVFEARAEDMSVDAVHDSTEGFERDFVVRRPAFFESEIFLRQGETLTKIDVPDSASASVHREWLLVRLRHDWTLAGRTYAGGSLLAAGFEAFLAGERDLTLVFAPDEHTSLRSWTWTRSHLVLTLLRDVRTELVVLTPSLGGPWGTSELGDLASLATVDIGAVDADESDDVWIVTTDFLHPTTLLRATVGGASTQLRALPAFFDGSGHEITQRFATSDDGTRVPYFLVAPTGSRGTAPTLLHGYGGFEVSSLPSYSALLGKAWLESGGVYALANIRGGGEYGPAWHAAGLRERRHLVYEDFAAVARDLVSTGVTTPDRLAATGGSNGGLLVGNMLTSYADLFGALIGYVPLFDMQRYTKLLAGASWVAEYGDPDVPADWEFLQRYSTYQRFDPDAPAPPMFIWTTTRDDRVHPGHARKLAALMEASGKDVRYFENVEGGHGAGGTNAQTARTWALHYAFLRSTIGR